MTYLFITILSFNKSSITLPLGPLVYIDQSQRGIERVREREREWGGGIILRNPDHVSEIAPNFTFLVF